MRGLGGGGVEQILTTAKSVVRCTISDPCMTRIETLPRRLEHKSFCRLDRIQLRRGCLRIS
jgi:hypothetical protein